MSDITLFSVMLSVRICRKKDSEASLNEFLLCYCQGNPSFHLLPGQLCSLVASMATSGCCDLYVSAK